MTNLRIYAPTADYKLDPRLEHHREICLSQGRVAIVDACDFSELSKYKWYRSSYGYAVRGKMIGGKQIKIFMHRQIMKAPKNLQIDHINNDKLDNRKANLRICTQAENARNRPRPSNNKSGFKGVIWREHTKGFSASIVRDGKRTYLGYFHTAEDAARAYNRAAIEKHGEFKKFNNVTGCLISLQSRQNSFRRRPGSSRFRGVS